MASTNRILENLLKSCTDNRAYAAGKHLHARMLRLDLLRNSFLSTAIIDFYSKCSTVEHTKIVFESIPNKDIFGWNSMLGVYSKAGKLQDAYSLFDRMPGRNIVSWNTVIAGSTQWGYEEHALVLYHGMLGEGFVPNRFTLCSVLSACGMLVKLKQGRLCHIRAVKLGIEDNMYVGNALLFMYSRCLSIDDAILAFEMVPNPNEVSFTALMSGLSRCDRTEDALELFTMMHKNGICVDSVSISSIFGVLARAGNRDFGVVERVGSGCDLHNCHGRQVHCLSFKLGHESDLHLSNSLLDMYAKNGMMDTAEMIFSNMGETSVVSFNVMIAGYGLKSQIDKALSLFHRMLEKGPEPDDISYVSMFTACVLSGDVLFGREMFNTVKNPSLSSWNAMLSGYSHRENHEDVVNLFREMQFQHYLFDSTTLSATLSSCTVLSLLNCGKQVHAASHKSSLHMDVFVASGLIDLYSKCGKIRTSELVFHRLPEPDIVCWNSLISAFSLHSMEEEAFTLFKKMRENGISPTEFSYSTILSCCAKHGSSSQGKQAHALITKEGFQDNVYVGSTLIDMYSKGGGGDIIEAQKLFGLMPFKNTVTWNQMILGLAHNGLGSEAVNLYHHMILSGHKPDEITFLASLTACSHGGLVDAGIEIFRSMKIEHGVDPGVDHYTCFIDCLGRAGRLHEVESIINDSRFQDDSIMWEVLLSSCRVHGDVELAKRAAEVLFMLDPGNSTPYVLLANVYSSLGRWEEAREIRENMSEKGLRKGAGFSRITDGSREDHGDGVNVDAAVVTSTG